MPYAKQVPCQICATPFPFKPDQKTCSRRCRLIRLTRIPLIERLMRHVDPMPNPHGCWIWIGAKSDYGHGEIRINGRCERAHRISYELVHGIVLPGFEVCHNCPGSDNPACINPDHLFVGTHRDNLQDAMKKNRIRKGANHPSVFKPERVPHGIQKSNSKLTDDIVRHIRSYETPVPILALSKQFRVRPTCIWKVYTRHSWKHVQ